MQPPYQNGGHPRSSPDHDTTRRLPVARSLCMVPWNVPWPLLAPAQERREVRAMLWVTLAESSPSNPKTITIIIKQAMKFNHRVTTILYLFGIRKQDKQSRNQYSNQSPEQAGRIITRAEFKSSLYIISNINQELSPCIIINRALTIIT